MTQIIQVKKSSTPSAVPTTGDLLPGEIAINTNDAKLFIEKDDGSPSIFEMGSDKLTESSGDWSPELWDATLSGSESQTYTKQVGKQIAQGNIVYIKVDLEMLSLGTLTTSDAIRIGNLPFVTADDGVGGALAFSFGGSLAITALASPMGLPVANNNYINLRQWDATVGASDLLISELTSNGRLILAGFYFI